VTVLLVRHADAGNRSDWEGDDRLRPLSPKGNAQAAGLVRVLGDRWAPDRIATSAFVRCVASVAPLASVFERDVHIERELNETTDPPVAMRWLRHVAAMGGITVACTHGDVLEGVLEIVRADDGLDLGEGLCQKGSTWALEARGDRFISGEYLEPPK
jgi:8-oxo-dGTP diphosphatase